MSYEAHDWHKCSRIGLTSCTASTASLPPSQCPQPERADFVSAAGYVPLGQNLTSNERPVVADFVEEVGGLTIRDGARSRGARGFIGVQAGTGAGSGISFASFRRFWTVAASRNSS